MDSSVKRLLIPIILILTGALSAAADNYWYKTGSGPDITVSANGSFTVKILTYDYDGMDDWLSYMDVYINAGGKDYTKVFTARCKHEYDEGDYKNGYGVINDKHPDFSFTTQTSSDGSKRYRTVTVKVPDYIWGTVNIKAETDWRYSHYGGQNIYSKEVSRNLGDCRVNLTPKCEDFNLDPDGTQYTARITDIPQVKNCSTELFLDLNGAIKRSYLTHCTDTTIVLPVPSSTSIDKENNKLTAYTKLQYGTTTAETATTKRMEITAEPFVVVDNLNADYNSVTRQVTLSWKLKNISESEYKYQLFRRRLKENGNPIDQYALIDSGKVITDQTSSVTIVNGHSDENPIASDCIYQYKVVMLRPNWDIDAKDSEWGGTGLVNITTKSDFNIDIATQGEPHGVLVKWAIPHSPEFLGDTIEIYRKDNKNNTLKIGTSIYQAAEVREENGHGSFLDDGIEYDTNGEPFSGKFKYWIKLLASDTWYHRDFESEHIDGVTTDISYIKTMSASKGNFAGKVTIGWNVRNYKVNGEVQKSTYLVSRRQTEVENADFVQLTQIDSDAENLTYTDEEALPGVYYDYKVCMRTKSTDGESEYEQNMFDIGFSSAYGKVSGRITYGTGTAVDGVDVVAIPSGNDGSFSASRCLYFPNTGASAVCEFTESRAQQYFGGNFTTQFWLNPLTKPLDLTNSNEKDLHTLINFCNHYRITLEPKPTGYLLACSQFDASGQKLEAKELIRDFPADKYSHVTIAVQGQQMRVTVFTPNADSISDTTCTVSGFEAFYSDGFSPVIKIGGGTLGLVDDFRIWKRALNADEIKANYNTSLVGNETDLVAYWRFDEGLASKFFDASKNGTMMNANHGTLEAGVKSTTLVPDANMLAYRCISDKDGNYMIDGIPYGGTGTAYNIVPSLGIHQFNPNKNLKYIGPNSLVFNDCNFYDVSSFSVSGTIYYKNTTYPVEGCYLYVDDVMCSKDNKPITTNESGQFVIDVPIGKHKIEAKMNNHDFGDDGKYEHTFNQRVTNLLFYDNTLVNLTGRVAGGNVEENKPLGFGTSVANIGQAVIEMEPIRTGFSLNSITKTDETMSWTENNPEELVCAVGEGADETINSHSYRGASEQANKIFINTDPVTGEFSAMVPPLEYRVNSAKTKNILVESNIILNLSDVAGVWHTDTIVPDSTLESKLKSLEYSYNKALKLTYHSEPTFTVEQEDAQPGAFGIETCEVKDLFGSEILQIYTVVEDGSIEYKYGESRKNKQHVPVFKMGENYTFLLKGYEEYINDDDEKNPIVSVVPLVGSVVTIRNELSDGQPIAVEAGPDGITAGDVADMQNETQTLNEKGEATYIFGVGFPNITAPYTRTISMDYLVGDSHKSWSGNGMEALVIGNMPNQNNNFVTEGPDHLTFVLRDPPGSRSSAQFKEGTTSTFTRYYGGVANSTVGGSETLHASFENQFGLGAEGYMTILKVKTINEQKIGASVKVGYEGAATFSTQTQINTTISTSDSPSFVGSEGDIFMGLSTNIIFGNAQNVGFWRETKEEPFKVDKKDEVSTKNITFETMFNYTQHYIIKYLIPNYKSLLDGVLQYADIETISNFTNESDKPVYLTPLHRDDPHYGTYNCDSIAWGNDAAPVGFLSGPSYWMFLPKNGDTYKSLCFEVCI